MRHIPKSHPTASAGSLIAIAFYLTSAQISHSQINDSNTNNALPPHSAVSNKLDKNTNGASFQRDVVARPFIVVNDQNSQCTALVDSGKRVVTLKDKNGKRLWSVDVVEKIKTPIVGEAKIRDVNFSGSNLAVTVGIHAFVIINLNTGIVISQGSD